MPPKKLPNLTRKNGLYLKHTAKKGRGVFCVNNLVKDTVLEITPAIVLNKRATKHADKTILADYTFSIGKVAKRHRLNNPEDASCVVMGIMSYCNHSEHPNAEIRWEERAGTVYYILTTTRAIPKNTEICTTYGAGWFADRK